ncbi:hypothetical protein [Hymenobacter weizhouensis]|uniref:hypothetical protein n=1 Tax=Hymenobacter sp. YIM 151500-1 TaxID=2987689 RepID=UPI002226C426|nr:hypothetical protein [Hymenobacter sp. YIM 151500-1]UYZ64891.1 hypothetical protein OIS53_08575 [Hymenobacter sp. YIM 151500-1]
MPTRKRAPQTLVLDSNLPEVAEDLITLDHFGDTGAFLCPNCGELLAWHDQDCTPSQAKPETVGEGPAPLPDAAPNLAPTPFAYALGQPVQPTPDALACPIIWRGQLKARHPRTGLVHRVNVYRLDNGYWDCYYEAELQAA